MAVYKHAILFFICTMDPEVLQIIEDFLNPPKKKPPIVVLENEYFLIELKLPKFSSSGIRELGKTEVEPVPKYRFLEMLENIHSKDFHSENPWFNEHIAKVRYQKALKLCKKVRFSKTEVESDLPHCRYRETHVKTPDGHVHAPFCRNSMLFSRSYRDLWFENQPKAAHNL